MQGVNESQAITHIIHGSEIHRSLGPKALASLQLLDSQKEITQKQIASEIQCGRSTVSKYFQRLSDLPIPLVSKVGRMYKITDPGQRVLQTIELAGRRNDIELEDTDWTTSGIIQSLDKLLTPLHDSRTVTPFFILFIVGKSLDNDGDNAEFRFGTVYHDVRKFQKVRGESITSQQVRQSIDRFVEAGAMESNSDRISMTAKGVSQYHLFESILEIVGDNHPHIPESSRYLSKSESPTASGSSWPSSNRIYSDGGPENMLESNRTMTLDKLEPHGAFLAQFDSNAEANKESVEQLTEELEAILKRTNISVFELERAVAELKQNIRDY